MSKLTAEKLYENFGSCKMLSGPSLKDLKNRADKEQIPLSDLINTGFNVEQLIMAGFSLDELVKTGSNLKEIIDFQLMEKDYYGGKYSLKWYPAKIINYLEKMGISYEKINEASPDLYSTAGLQTTEVAHQFRMIKDPDNMDREKEQEKLLYKKFKLSDLLFEKGGTIFPIM